MYTFKMISAFVRRELQLSFYANETTIQYMVNLTEKENNIDFYPQYF